MKCFGSENERVEVLVKPVLWLCTSIDSESSHLILEIIKLKIKIMVAQMVQNLVFFNMFSLILILFIFSLILYIFGQLICIQSHLTCIPSDLVYIHPIYVYSVSSYLYLVWSNIYSANLYMFSLILYVSVII